MFQIINKYSSINKLSLQLCCINNLKRTIYISFIAYDEENQKNINKNENQLEIINKNNHRQYLKEQKEKLLDRGRTIYKNSNEKIYQQYETAYNFYERFTHMDEVREAQNKVIGIQLKLADAQQKRIDALQLLNNIHREIEKVREQIADYKKTDLKSLEYQRKFILLNQEERDYQSDYEFKDATERNLFTYLTSAVNSSHEKANIYANTVKYWSVILSVLAALLGITGTVISHHYRQKSYMEMSLNYTQQIESLKLELIKVHSDINVLAQSINLNRIEQRENMKEVLKIVSSNKKSESWGSFFSRYTSNVYRFFIPNKKNVSNN